MSSGAYDLAREAAAKGQLNLASTNVKVKLISNSYTFDTTHTLGTVGSYEVSGSGYDSGGKALGSPTVTLDTSAHKARLWANDLTWTALTVTGIRGALLYDTYLSIPIYYWDFGTDKDPAAQDLTLEWDDTDGVTFLD